jgi:hypothetical protein
MTSPIIHHVFFWLKNPSSKEDLERLLKGLNSLKSIDVIKDIYIGVPAATEKRPVINDSYSASELLIFDNLEAQRIYQEHPVHQQFIADCSSLWERVVVYDIAVKKNNME